MSSFRSALRVAAAHPVYLIVYLLLLSLLGVFVVGAAGSAAQEHGDPTHAFGTRVAVVDRDGSELSEALGAHLGAAYELVEVADDDFAMQDALAQSLADAVFVVPEGFGEDCLASARDGREMPALEVAFGTDARAGALASQEASRWLALAAASAALEPEAGQARVAELAEAASAARVQVDAAPAPDGSPDGADVFLTYLAFSSYSLCCTVVVCGGVVLVAFNRPAARRRLAAGPLPPSRRSAGVLAACAALALAAWAWLSGVGIAVCREGLAGVDPVRVALCVACLLVFALVPLALAFLLSQFGLGEEGMNAVGNIAGSVMAFLGGAWVPLDYMDEVVQAAARFVPTYWAYDAMRAALVGHDPLRVASGLAIVVLFAVAIGAVGLAVGRTRAQLRAV